MKRKCQYCGRINNLPLLMFRLMIKEKVYHRCSCGKVSCYVLISHVVHDTTDDKEKEVNKLLNDNLKGVWRNG